MSEVPTCSQMVGVGTSDFCVAAARVADQVWASRVLSGSRTMPQGSAKTGRVVQAEIRGVIATASISSYASALRAAGVMRGNYWAIAGIERGPMGLTLAWAGDEEHGTLSLACHLVPASWVAGRFAEEEADGIDVCWSWADVVALYEDRGRAGLTDSLSEVDEEGQNS